MKIVDLHCDTISSLSRYDEALFKNDGQFDLVRAREAGMGLQFMALFAKPTDSNAALRVVMKQVDKFYREIEMNCASTYHLINRQQLSQTDNQDKLACVLHLEGAECLGTDMEILRLLYRLGLRSIGLTWNDRNLLADGIGEGPQAGGLSRQGREVVAEMEKMGMMLDLAHISEKAFYEALECYAQPVLVTHANARALCPHWRNLTDNQLQVLAEHGGIVGVTQVADFVKEGEANLNDFLDQLVYIVDLIGIEHIALGSDFDGADDMVINSVAGYAELPAHLATRGFTVPEIEKILSGNALGLIQKVLR